MNPSYRALLLGVGCLLLAYPASAATFRNPFGGPVPNPTPADHALAAYLETQTRDLESAALSEIRSGADFLRSKENARRQLREMLGLEPMPARSELKATVTGMVEKEDVVVEKIHFQSRPGLYVTANLYRPKQIRKPLPAILYTCGHGAEKLGGISYGNKVHYQHWGAWFARNGYVCLSLDSVQLGEIEGIHHGTHHKGMWWWNSRGFTSAGIEAWNGIRALDYLETRSEVDKTRLGVTGRSGGGAYAWWVAALDERIRVACPTAGITDLRNQILDSCVEGHCDCMFQVNTYRWDFAQVAALIAPRPLLIVNTDKDPIFPLDGVHRLYEKVRRVYDLVDKPRQLGLAIGEGPHHDIQEIQLPVLRWFNRWLKQDEAPVPNFADKLFTHEDLRVFQTLPSDEISSRAFETFIDPAPEGPTPDLARTVTQLRAKTFAGWPCLDQPMELRASPGNHHWQFKGLGPTPALLRAESPVRLTSRELHLILEETGVPYHPVALPNEAAVLRFTPVGAGSAGLGGDTKSQTTLRRKLMLVGTTLASLQVYEVVRALDAVRSIPGFEEPPTLHLHAPESLTEVAVFAALFCRPLGGLHLQKAPRSEKEAPDFLSWSRLITPTQLLELARQRSPVVVPN
jgi:dienelactone hydrolase